MRISNWYRPIMFGLLISLLAACGSSATPAPTLPPQPTIGNTISATDAPITGCERSQLENWLQRSSGLTKDFTDLLKQSAGLTADQIAPQIDKMAQLRGLVMTIGAPNCAADHFQTLTSTMQGAIDTFGAFRKGEKVDLPTYLGTILIKFDEIKAKEQALKALHDSLPQ